MSTEARDALAAALYEANVARTLSGPIAEAILRNLPDGWTLARREDAEDGAARDVLSPDDLHGALKAALKGTHGLTDMEIAERMSAHLRSLAAARKAKDALGGVG